MAQKTWMITGASRGFGAEMAKAVLASGDRLIATARQAESLRHLGESDNLLALALDVTDEGQVQAAVDRALQRFGGIDVLVNNAGYGLLGAVEECGPQEIEKVYRTNVFGLLAVTRAVLPGMRQRKSGHVINFSSIGGYRALPGWGVYCSTKFAVEGLTEALHAELAPLGIHATLIEPGAFRTDFLDERSLVKSANTIPDYAATAGKTRQAAPGRNHQQPGDPAKLARAVLRIAAPPEPPLRLPLGSDALRLIAEKNDFVAKGATCPRPRISSRIPAQALAGPPGQA